MLLQSHQPCPAAAAAGRAQAEQEGMGFGSLGSDRAGSLGPGVNTSVVGQCRGQLQTELLGCSAPCSPAGARAERGVPNEGCMYLLGAPFGFWEYWGSQIFVSPFEAFWKIACLNETFVCEL